MSARLERNFKTARLSAIGTLLLFSFALMNCSRNEARPKTVHDRLTEFGAVVRTRLEPHFRAADVPYPPKHLTLLGFKDTRLLEIHAAGDDGNFRFIRSYPVLAASGHLGPKLREGDRQVPEGIYRIQELNPNSRFLLSLWIDYPNAFDRQQAAAENRSDLGGEIMIHGNAVSAGCLAMGDAAAEDLFVLAALTRIENISVVLTPIDFRKDTAPFAAPNESPSWTTELYQQIRRELSRYEPPAGTD